MKEITFVQPYFEYRETIYPALYKILKRLTMMVSRVEVRTKRRKLKRK